MLQIIFGKSPVAWQKKNNTVPSLHSCNTEAYTDRDKENLRADHLKRVHKATTDLENAIYTYKINKKKEYFQNKEPKYTNANTTKPKEVQKIIRK